MEEVDIFNEEMYRKTFCKDVNHAKDCVLDTIGEMAQLLSKTCHCFNAPVDEILKHLYVEAFDTHLRKILDVKKYFNNKI